MKPNLEKKITIESPGRINLIGEHIDYNGGFVLPAAINHTITISVEENDTDKCNIYSIDFDARFDFDLNKVEPSETEWENYILGVVHQIQQLKPNVLRGFDCKIKSNLPIGSGISSSAALECGVATALNELFKIGLTKTEIIQLSQKAEHEFVGTQCGIMDQFAVVRGKKDKLILLNCQNLEYDYIPADLSPYTLVLLNTNVVHSLSGSEYNNRLEECAEALTEVQNKYSSYNYLADIPEVVAVEFKDQLPEKIYNRMLFVSQETNRVLEATKALASKDYNQLGSLIYESHKGLTNLYEVSCEELDFLVDFTLNKEQVLGSRMMGGGFGGCTINLVHKDYKKTLIEEISVAYKNEFNIDLTPIEISIEDGVTKLTNQ